MSDLTLVIGNKNYSSWSLRPWFYLKHFGFAFEEVRISLYSQDYKEKILRFSPSGKVPFLKDGDLGIWDSLAIMEYLSDAYPDKQGWPGHPRARAIARSISAEMHSGFFTLREQLPMNIRKVFKGFVPTDKAVPEINRVKQIWTGCRKEFGAGGPWLFGTFSIADCMYAPVAMRFLSYGVTLGTTETDYLHAVKNHPAIVEWTAAAKAETEIIEADEINL
jgi:glutathione S-transferase